MKKTTQQAAQSQSTGMKVKTKIKAGPGGGLGCTLCSLNHNQSAARVRRSR